MDKLQKILNTLCGLPVVGGYMTFFIGLIPAAPIFAIGLGDALAATLYGLLTAAWTFFLQKSGLLKIVTPFIPMPLWIFALAIAAYGVYRMIFGL